MLNPKGAITPFCRMTCERARMPISGFRLLGGDKLTCLQLEHVVKKDHTEMPGNGMVYGVSQGTQAVGLEAWLSLRHCGNGPPCCQLRTSQCPAPFGLPTLTPRAFAQPRVCVPLDGLGLRRQLPRSRCCLRPSEHVAYRQCVPLTPRAVEITRGGAARPQEDALTAPPRAFIALKGH